MRTLKSILIFGLLLGAGQTLCGQQKGYYRYPVIHGNIIIFTAEGDLWKFNLTTNEAKRLITNHGVESHASISADGQRIAFVGQ